MHTRSLDIIHIKVTQYILLRNNISLEYTMQYNCLLTKTFTKLEHLE